VALGAGNFSAREAGGADISPLLPARVPFFGVEVDSSRYFDVHHTHADTLDKVDPQDLARSTAAVAWVTYALAEMPGTLVRPELPATTPGAPPAGPPQPKVSGH
ncbi:peptidase M28 family protein, partial [Pyxidicoccus sp. 3LG]